eukprot:118845-Chlamydomonas_euryale.AAC.3
MARPPSTSAACPSPSHRPHPAALLAMQAHPCKTLMIAGRTTALPPAKPRACTPQPEFCRQREWTELPAGSRVRAATIVPHPIPRRANAVRQNTKGSAVSAGIRWRRRAATAGCRTALSQVRSAAATRPIAATWHLQGTRRRVAYSVRGRCPGRRLTGMLVDSMVPLLCVHAWYPAGCGMRPSGPGGTPPMPPLAARRKRAHCSIAGAVVDAGGLRLSRGERGAGGGDRRQGLGEEILERQGTVVPGVRQRGRAARRSSSCAARPRQRAARRPDTHADAATALHRPAIAPCGAPHCRAARRQWGGRGSEQQRLALLTLGLCTQVAIHFFWPSKGLHRKGLHRQLGVFLKQSAQRYDGLVFQSAHCQLQWRRRLWGTDQGARGWNLMPGRATPPLPPRPQTH